MEKENKMKEEIVELDGHDSKYQKYFEYPNIIIIIFIKISV